MLFRSVSQSRYITPILILAMLDQYRWDNREGLTKEKPKHDEYSHMADALRYALYSYVI